MWSVKSRRWSAAGLVFLGIVVGVIFTSNFNWTPKGLASRNGAPVVLGDQSAPSETLLNLQDTGKAFTIVSKEILPTVVSISTSKIVRRSGREDDFFGPLFRDWFGRRNQQPETQRQEGLGSGVIVSKDGYILTNNHVIENADDINVTLHDNRTFKAELVGRDPLTDVGVIKIDGEDLPAARLGDSEVLEVGEWVLAVGNPLYLYSTVTAGIVSAKGRAIGIIQDQDADEGEGSYAIENFIQTDAAINHGNSGGALVNLKAEVIGINTAIASRTGYYSGYGFAIPINLAKKIMNDLIQKGYVTRAWVGIGMNAVDENVAQRYNMDRPRGVIIIQVNDDSPAQKAGLRTLDIILKLDGKDVNQSNEVQNYIALKDPEDTVVFTILRDGKERQVRVKLGQKDTGRERVRRSDDEEAPTLGLEVETLTDDIRSRIDYYGSDEGVIVTGVEAYSTAYDAGIRRGDLIMQIEDYEIASESDYRRALKNFEKDQVVIFYMKRRNTELHAFVKISE